MRGNAPDGHDRPEEPLVTARKVIEWRMDGGPLPALPEAAILTHQGYLLPRRRLWRREPNGRAFSFEPHSLLNGRLLLTGVRGTGAPATAAAIEEMAACGVRRVVAVDIGGSLSPEVPSGGLVLPNAALACDGTSRHYTAGRVVRAGEALTALLRDRLTSEGLAFAEGAVWSTDAVYRETPSLIHAARAEGAVLADMETACVFAVSSALGIEAAALLVAADELHAGWRRPRDMRRVQTQVRRALALATAALLP